MSLPPKIDDRNENATAPVAFFVVATAFWERKSVQHSVGNGLPPTH